MRLLHTPKKPEGVDHKSAYLIGSGLAALTAACYLVRDGQMKGEHVHVFEKDPIPGGACDGYQVPDVGYVMRGGREMDNHFEVMWDLLRSIPSLETEGASVLDEYYWLNKDDPNYSLCRATVNRGEDAHTDGKFGLSDKGAMEIMKLFFTPGRGSCRTRRSPTCFDDEVLRLQLLALLADHVRLRELAQRPGDEALPQALYPPHRRPARLHRPPLYPLQPV